MPRNQKAAFGTSTLLSNQFETNSKRLCLYYDNFLPKCHIGGPTTPLAGENQHVPELQPCYLFRISS